MLERYWSRSRGPGYIPGVDDDFAQFAKRHGVLGELAEQSSRHAGLVARLLGAPATAVITGLELGTGLTGQERNGKVIVQVGTGLAAGAAGSWLAGTMMAGAALGPSAAVIVLVGLGAWGISSFVGAEYERLVPESPRDKLERYG